MKIKSLSLILVFIAIAFSCSKPSNNSYSSYLDLAKTQTKVIELTTNDGQSRIAIAPQYQGKLLTTSYGGKNGISNGYLNKDVLSGKDTYIENIGGEDRIWLGPLGGQFSFYYQHTRPISEDNWQVPSALGIEGYQLTKVDKKEVSMEKQMILNNFVGTSFYVKVLRTIKILDASDIETKLSLDLEKSIDYVAFESDNNLVNIGPRQWKKETGLVSLWSAGMFEGSDASLVIIPLKKEATLNDIYKYLQPLYYTRIQLAKNNIILFKADGKYRSKIGIPPALAPDIYGCYAKDKNRLTIVQYKKTNDSLYSNSHVTVQKNPYEGEVIPIYNDNPNQQTDAASFFELESNSTMKELHPKDTLKHWHRVYHFSGSEAKLSKISKKLLGIDLKDCVFKE